jgi:hypothetical protein
MGYGRVGQVLGVGAGLKGKKRGAGSIAQCPFQFIQNFQRDINLHLDYTSTHEKNLGF